MKNILVVGATSAIAMATCRLWASQGARFLLSGRDPQKLADMAQDLTTRGATEVSVHVMDMADLDAHPTLIQSLASFLPTTDVALLAHGTLPDQAACEVDPAIAAREFHLNAAATIALLLRLAPIFERQKFGAIGVITSVAGDRGRRSNYVYGSAKAAVSVFCSGLRARLFQSGVTLTDIKPGFIRTPMTEGLDLPSLLVADPAQIAPRISSALSRGQAVVYTPRYWFFIMLAIRSIPTSLFKKLSL